MRILAAALLLGLLAGCVPMMPLLGFHITEGGKFTTDPVGTPSRPTQLRSDCYGAAGCVTHQIPVYESSAVP
jgi:hypothetical protein